MLPLDGFDRNNKMVEMCYKTHTTTVNPIIDWTESEVWEFIKEYKVPYCCLYDEGFKRLGCIGCPMGSRQQREAEFERYPKYKALYMKAFEKMVENRGGGTEQRTDIPQTAEEYMDGHITEKYRRENRGGGNTLYPYAKTRVTKDFSEMSAEEIIDWWID